ncbi:MAG: DUF4202 family protein [Candidatus Paceibacterota bacterium]|jgi:hypothetical protein
MKLYNKADKFVERAFGKNGMKHFRRTVFWVKKLHPEADEAMLIAAISHDLERAFRKDGAGNPRDSEKGFLDGEHLKIHQKEGAKIIFDFLVEEGADSALANRVRELVEAHEVGGDKEQNILKDADSISFFENNAGHFIEKKARELGKEKVKEKFDWMFDRITSKKAKEISERWYERAIKELGY